ncbi:MAG: cytochrome c-type biogenesis protein CcmH [Solirubrobacteraceae bacterium]
MRPPLAAPASLCVRPLPALGIRRNLSRIRLNLPGIPLTLPGIRLNLRGIRLNLPRVIAVFVLLAATATTTTAAAATTKPRASLLEVESQLMCPSCHEPLEAVSSPQALYEKAYVKTLIARGDTDQQILNNLVSQYGVVVLAKPPASGFNLLIYILPPLVPVAGVAFLLLTLPKWRERSRAAAAAARMQPVPALSEADSKRIDDDLSRLI